MVRLTDLVKKCENPGVTRGCFCFPDRGLSLKVRNPEGRIMTLADWAEKHGAELKDSPADLPVCWKTLLLQSMHYRTAPIAELHDLSDYCYYTHGKGVMTFLPKKDTAADK